MSPAAKTKTDIYLPEPATIVRAESMTALERFIAVKFDSGRELGHKPGQFVQIYVPGIGEAPISISSSPSRNGGFEMVVRRVGNVTNALHRLAAGARVGVRGPFGTDFPVAGALKGQDLLFICGGIGLVPVRSAIDYVLDHRADYGRVIILSGTKTPDDRLFRDAVPEWQRQPDVAYMETVDRGGPAWRGPVGVITTLMPKVAIEPARTTAIVCGPPIMYKFVVLELARMQLPHERIYISLERHMKCGVGKCGHCQVNGLYACQEAPVFRYADVANVREAI